MRFHYHPCTADVPLIACSTFQNGAPDIYNKALFKATCICILLKHSIPTCYSLHKL